MEILGKCKFDFFCGGLQIRVILLRGGSPTYQLIISGKERPTASETQGRRRVRNSGAPDGLNALQATTRAPLLTERHAHGPSSGQPRRSPQLGQLRRCSRDQLCRWWRKVAMLAFEPG